MMGRSRAVNLFVFLVAVLFAFVASSSVAWAQMKVRLNWSATAGTQSGFWVAQEEGIFKKNGLEVELIHIPSSSRAIQTMLAGELWRRP
jgi:ABC-type nitrate/sulfonate/bicarbonate transport system substrate-binding protein